MKSTLLLLFLMIALMSCGGGNEGSTTGETTDNGETTVVSNTTEENGGEATTTTTTTPSNSKITVDVVEKVCGCVSSSKDDSGSMDVTKMRECMGGSSVEFIANLLGAEASDKEKSDALEELQEKTANCPQ